MIRNFAYPHADFTCWSHGSIFFFFWKGQQFLQHPCTLTDPEWLCALASIYGSVSIGFGQFISVVSCVHNVIVWCTVDCCCTEPVLLCPGGGICFVDILVHQQNVQYDLSVLAVLTITDKGSQFPCSCILNSCSSLSWDKDLADLSANFFDAVAYANSLLWHPCSWRPLAGAAAWYWAGLTPEGDSSTAEQGTRNHQQGCCDTTGDWGKGHFCQTWAFPATSFSVCTEFSANQCLGVCICDSISEQRLVGATVLSPFKIIPCR